MEKALEVFVDKWKSKKYIEGILLSGSYAVGLQNENSDIDIRLIFNSKYKKNKKGLEVINNYKFSHLGRTAESTSKTFSTEFFNHNKFEARIFSIGKVLYDQNNKTESLIEKAKVYLHTPFIHQTLNKEDIDTNMYALYSSKIYLESLSENSSFFFYHYFNFLRQAMRFYAKFLGYEFFLDSKTEQILTDEVYQKTYSWDKFPDHEFVKIWLPSLGLDHANNKSVALIYYYLEKVIAKVDEEKFTMSWEE
ncbi:nucleotidyltransferase domain-containing protein [Chryseobacterium soli]|uniref:nucleotidyltransferase domain-containing protein n=1 Tax=Chryseobacterium soli TaxID=445961 RepID=UPI002954EAB4|nr:nucleotidyltransferase domain-containing protein [Chryseobacterium soli]MDV7696966.1 nucleotidyltransferase domain-containing protein [Chryseobacterium soli]